MNTVTQTMQFRQSLLREERDAMGLLYGRHRRVVLARFDEAICAYDVMTGARLGDAA